MNIYSRKQVWKIILFFVAALIFAVSVIYTNLLVKRIEEEERTKALLWAEAIQKKADLVKYTHELFEELKLEERKKGELWANGIKQLMTISSNQDLTFIFEVVKNNETIPVILTDSDGNMINSRNVDPSILRDPERIKKEIQAMGSQYPPIQISISPRVKNYLYYKDSKLFSQLKEVMDNLIESFISEVVINSASVPVIYTDSSKHVILDHNLRLDDAEQREGGMEAYLQSTLAKMKESHEPIRVELSNEGKVNFIYYQESFLLTQLRYYPYVQFTVIGVFLMVAYVLFSISRRAEQNQVWVGMSKETAHQLGTPISSLLAWMELLKAKYGDDPTLDEILKDVQRLEVITDRFSKVGSAPKLDRHNLKEILENALNYLRTRISKHVTIDIRAEGVQEFDVKLNVPLFEWVIENLSKNAVDAMGGQGELRFEVYRKGDDVYIDVSDTGKGIPKSKFKTIFQPGYTTKQRGWGLGLTLVKRIVEEYHRGKIFVLKSDPQNGTTFRIILNL